MVYLDILYEIFKTRFFFVFVVAFPTYFFIDVHIYIERMQSILKCNAIFNLIVFTMKKMLIYIFSQQFEVTCTAISDIL